MNRILPQLREDLHQNNYLEGSNNIVFWDSEENFAHRCRICFQEDRRLVNPCHCNMEYHQRCLLKYIKGRIVAMGNQVDFSQIRCRHCGDQIRFLSHHNTQYGCSYFAAKMRRDWCNKTLSIILFLLLIIIVIAVIIVLMLIPDTTAHLAMLIVEALLSTIELGIIIVFVHHNLMYREIILVKVYHSH